MLERIGVSLEDDLLSRFDRLIGEKGYVNRSEAIRDLIRDALVQREWSESPAREERVAVVTLVYDHDSSSLAQKLAHIQHENHKAVVSALHVHMDEHNCLEVLVLRGRARDVVSMGEGLVSTKGVKYGKVVPATTGQGLR
ncbi:nickel-responsive transcriptional regulator NikR [Anaeromyxobacter oryzae]|uniref:Putative nickel-responsive regulator n=1 Tax=Anaeromyxobacter oryzae TaxID=2918170 RepID=A0ABN6ML81_9BACT|nr:nickel-responsive transcriptional regulator NikR [Anaeromyxobacter oryzae]BDG01812.1 putative nickel-responsive regulator [Anaeromyxobacter oryzae]